MEWYSRETINNIMKPTTRRENKNIEDIYMSMFKENEEPQPLRAASRVLGTEEEEEEDGKPTKDAPKAIQDIRKQAAELVDVQKKELDQAAKDIQNQDQS